MRVCLGSRGLLPPFPSASSPTYDTGGGGSLSSTYLVGGVLCDSQTNALHPFQILHPHTHDPLPHIPSTNPQLEPRAVPEPSIRLNSSLLHLQQQLRFLIKHLTKERGSECGGGKQGLRRQACSLQHLQQATHKCVKAVPQFHIPQRAAAAFFKAATQQRNRQQTESGWPHRQQSTEG